MPKQKIETFETVLQVMLYALGGTGAVLFAIIAYLEGMPL